MEQVEECTGLKGPLPEGVVYHGTVGCPTSGSPHCMADFDPAPCPDNPEAQCGTVAAYVDRCEQIHLPDQWSAGFAHEIIHHLLRVNGRQDWKEHTAPEFKCQVFRY